MSCGILWPCGLHRRRHGGPLAGRARGGLWHFQCRGPGPICARGAGGDRPSGPCENLLVQPGRRSGGPSTSVGAPLYRPGPFPGSLAALVAPRPRPRVHDEHGRRVRSAVVGLPDGAGATPFGAAHLCVRSSGRGVPGGRRAAGGRTFRGRHRPQPRRQRLSQTRS